MSRLAAFALALAVFVLVGGGIYHYRDRVVTFVETRVLPSCSVPLPYTVGSIDSQFGLSKEQVVAKLDAAATLWNTAAGKTVLVYAPNDPSAMPINFVYDTRQQTISVGSAIDSTEATQEAERRQLEQLQVKHRTAQTAYASAVDTLNSESDVYAKEVRRVNQSGGADKATYDRLNEEKARLEREQQAIEAQGVALEAEGQELQVAITNYNKKVSAINQIVENFNAAAGGDFEEGQFTEDAKGKRIDIYAYKNQSELLHSLTHELGHALGLPHNQNSVSIMFPYNKSSVTLSSEDRAALKLACKL